jgi:hypothetical protein
MTTMTTSSPPTSPENLMCLFCGAGQDQFTSVVMRADDHRVAICSDCVGRSQEILAGMAPRTDEAALPPTGS